MNWDWQYLSALALAIASAAYLARRGWRAMTAKRRVGCATACGGCEANRQPSAQPLVSPELLARTIVRPPDRGA